MHCGENGAHAGKEFLAFLRGMTCRRRLLSERFQARGNYRNVTEPSECGFNDAQWRGCGIESKRTWITWDGNNLLWLRQNIGHGNLRSKKIALASGPDQV